MSRLTGMLIRRVLLLLVAAFCFSFSLQAQVTFKGKVVTNENAEPLENATIYFPTLNCGAISNSQGMFAVNNLPSGIFTVQVTAIGFKTVVREVNTATDSEITFILIKSVAQLGEVVITSGKQGLSQNTPYPVSITSMHELRKNASPSVMGNLSTIPGVSRISIGNGISKPVIRGLSFNRILLYAQGTRIENQQWDDHHDLSITDVGVESVELVRGPSALMYGAGAMGGAIIFRDESPAPQGKTTGDVNLGFASNTLGINAGAGIKHTGTNGFFYGVRVGGTSQTSYLQGEGNENEYYTQPEKEDFAFNSKFMNYSGKAFAGYSGKFGMTKLTYSYFGQQTGIVEDESQEISVPGKDEEAEQREREIEAPYQNVNTHIVSSENVFVTGTSSVSVNLSFQNNTRREYEPVPGKKRGELAVGLDLNAFTGTVKWSSDLENPFGLTLGIEGMYLTSRNTGTVSLVPDADETGMSGFALLRYDKNKFNLLAGARLDYRKTEAGSYLINTDTKYYQLSTLNEIRVPDYNFTKNYNPVSFSAGGVYQISDLFMTKVNMATGFSPPDYAQLATFGKHEGTYRFETGNPGLQTEMSMEGDVGIRFEHTCITIYFTAYYNSIMDYIYLMNTGDSVVRVQPQSVDTLPQFNYTQGDASIYGFEVILGFHPKRAKWLLLNGTYEYIKGELSNGSPLPYMPSDKISGELKISGEKLWKFTGTSVSVVVSNFMKRKDVAEYEISCDGYTLTDLYLGGAFNLFHKQAILNLYCTNLFNTGYYNQLSLIKSIGVKDMGRNIGFQIKLNIGDQL